MSTQPKKIYNQDKKCIRLIASDLDSTLLTYKKTLSPVTVAVLEEAMDKGIYFVPATGRTYGAYPSYLQEIPKIRYCIFSNGAVVMDLKEQKEVYFDGISCERAIELLEMIKEFDAYYDFYCGGVRYTSYEQLSRLREFKIEQAFIDLIESTGKPVENLMETLRQLNAPIEKINLYFADLEYREVIRQTLDQIEDIQTTTSLYNNLEINCAGCDKGKALKGLASYLQIPVAETMAFGDGENDLELLEAAGIGVAMENAIPKLKEVADCITDTNDQYGVAKAILSICEL